MKLPDFNEFEPFNELRRKMNTDELGYFELFDPKFHLTGVERSDLERKGVVVSSSYLFHLLDFTLVYKNSRVCTIDSSIYHLAHCAQFPHSNKYEVATSLQVSEQPLTVCKACLQTLQYKGFDSQKARKEAYSLQVFENFKLEEFWRQFHIYPVSEKRDLRKLLKADEKHQQCNSSESE
jgi:hypothetical protein